MIKKIKILHVLALGISLSIAGCNESGKKDEKSATTDSAANVKTEVVQPAAEEVMPDALKAAPGLYKIISDTLGIRMVEVTYKPGDSSALHSHPDYALYVTSGGMATFYGKDGTKREMEMKTGMTTIRPAEVHSVKNTGKTTIKVILFEVNRPKDLMTTDAAMSATKVAPDLYKVKADTLGIRVLEINYKPGQSSAMHSHPDNALYVMSGSKSEFTDKDGKKSVVELKTGATMIGAAETHSVKNIGNSTVKAILVEVFRKR